MFGQPFKIKAQNYSDTGRDPITNCEKGNPITNCENHIVKIRKKIRSQIVKKVSCLTTNKPTSGNQRGLFQLLDYMSQNFETD